MPRDLIFGLKNCYLLVGCFFFFFASGRTIQVGHILIKWFLGMECLRVEEMYLEMCEIRQNKKSENCGFCRLFSEYLTKARND